ncbi:MAG: hypothetical protein LRZ84_05425 [Desertifilum sp.]|nr:hypothetical protein [Desertifilum sp.]
MPEYQESGLLISLPDEDSFRFQDNIVYQKLKGKNLAEMDFAWWDTSKSTLYLMDVKDYSHLTPSEKLPEPLLEKLIAKVTDSLMILSSAWIGTGQGQQIKIDLPMSCQTFPLKPKSLKIIFVLKIKNSTLKAELSPLKTRLVNRLQGRLALFDLRNVTLIDHEIAINMGLPITEIKKT